MVWSVPAASSENRVGRVVLLGLFIMLLVEQMLDLELNFVRGLSLKNFYLYSLLGLMMLGALMRGRIVPCAPPYTVNVAFFLLWSYAGLSWYLAPQLNLWNLPYDRIEGLVALKRLIDQHILFLVFLLAMRSRDDVLWVVRGMLACIALSSVITLIDVYNIVDLGIIHEREDGRVSGSIGESNQFGAFMVLFLPGILAMPFLSRGPKRVLWTIGAIASATALLLTVSRGALSAIVVGAVLGSVYLRRYIPRGQLTRGAMVSIGISVLVVVVVMLQYGDLLYERLYVKTQTEDMAGVSAGRSEIWIAALGALSQHPMSYLVGNSWNMYDNMRLVGMYFYANHNTYLSFLFDLGVIGLCLYLALVFGVLRTARRGIAQMAPYQQQTELMMFVIGFIGLLWAIFFVNLFKPWLLIWTYIGLMMRLALSAPITAPERVP
jgi:O-antigen ligase